MAANEARRDLKEKIKLENALSDALLKFNRGLVRRTIQTYAVDGHIFQANVLISDLIALLVTHYENVANIFSTQMTDILPEDIPTTDDERNSIMFALATYFAIRAPEQARLITQTNQENIDESISDANDIAMEQSTTTGEIVTRTEIAVTAGALLSRKLTGRRRGIAALETQSAAETSKGTEVEVLLRLQPSVVNGPTPRRIPVMKEWVTVGDERVRDAHRLADAQTREQNVPFEVGGQLLKWPGDMSLGATVDNVINCRCSSVTNRRSFFAVRRRLHEAPAIETTPSEQLLTSLGEEE